MGSTLGACKRENGPPEATGTEITLDHDVSLRIPSEWAQKEMPTSKVTGSMNPRGSMFAPLDDAGSSARLRLEPSKPSSGSDDDELLYRCMLDGPPHRVEAAEIRALGNEWFGWAGDAKDFALRSAETRIVHGVRVLVVEGTILPSKEDQLSAYLAGDEVWPARLELRSPPEDFGRYAPRVQESIASIHPPGPVAWTPPPEADCRDAHARRAAGKRSSVEWFPDNADVYVRPGERFGLGISAPCAGIKFADQGLLRLEKQNVIFPDFPTPFRTFRAVFSTLGPGEATVAWACTDEPRSGSARVHIGIARPAEAGAPDGAASLPPAAAATAKRHPFAGKVRLRRP